MYLRTRGVVSVAEESCSKFGETSQHEGHPPSAFLLSFFLNTAASLLISAKLYIYPGAVYDGFVFVYFYPC